MYCCSAKDVEGKKHRLFFPQGRGFLNGWALLVEKLRGLGIKRQEEIPLSIIKTAPTEEEGKERFGPRSDNAPCGGPQVTKVRAEGNCKADNTVWVDVGDCGSGKALGILQWCLIGKWKTRAEPIPGEKTVESWGREVWRLNKGLRVATLNEELLFLEFESPEEAMRVLETGRRFFRGGELQLERWNPYSGCIRSKGAAQEEWIRVIGLPPHMWKMEVMKKIGDACGGFIAMDKSTEQRMEMKWARILIKATGAHRPSTVNILEGPRSFEFQIWWEVLPWVTDVYPAFARVAAKSLEDEEDVEARAERRMVFGRPRSNDGRQQGMVDRKEWQERQQGMAGQMGHVGTECVRVGPTQLRKRRGGNKKGEWVREKAGISSVGGGLEKQAASAPTEWAGVSNGLKGPHFYGPNTGSVNWANEQKALGWRILKRREEGQLFVNNTKAYLVGSGPAPSGPNPKAHRQVQRGPGRKQRGLKAVKEVLKYSAVETKGEDHAVRPGVKGASRMEVLVDPAWICAKGPFLDVHEERTDFKDCDSFESCGKAGLWEMPSECSFLISSCQGTTGNGSLNGQVLDLVERVSRGSQVEVAEDYNSRSLGPRYETLTSPNCSSPLTSIFGRPLLYGGPSGLGNGVEVMEDLEPLRVVSADGIEWGETTPDDPTAAIMEKKGCGVERGEVPKTCEEGKGYDNWEDSCLIKFSEFLGIPTEGYDVEILELLRRMVSQQPGNKRKGIPTETRSERELRRLECTINYSGKDQNRGGRDRGNFLLKLK